MTATNLTLNAGLAGLFAACEKLCERECCGINAFDFSPVHVASYMSAYTGGISPQDVQAYLDELDRLLAAGMSSPADANGLVCSIAGTNQYFTRESLSALVVRIKWAIGAAPEVLEHSDQLEAGAPPWPPEQEPG